MTFNRSSFEVFDDRDASGFYSGPLGQALCALIHLHLRGLARSVGRGGSGAPKIHFLWESLLRHLHALNACHVSQALQETEKFGQEREQGPYRRGPGGAALLLGPCVLGSPRCPARPAGAHVKRIKSVRKGSTTVGNHFVWVSETCA